MRSTGFAAAAEAHDLEALIATLDPDCVFRSPAVFKPYHGAPAIREVLGVVMQTFEDFRYVDQIEQDDRAVLVFMTRVGGREVHGIDMLRFGADGRITELTVMVRPLSAAIALAQAVGARLAAPA
ncbi:MAG TPA: nuclear transport factor 2 family protein [Actinomycetota bacterium]|nr:nuclear transport factor 2 family protein [Actinomycetota bacterium]